MWRKWECRSASVIRILICLGALSLAACAAGSLSVELIPEQVPAQSAFEMPGFLELITYNIAGLPEGISGSHPSRNIPKIGPRLSGFGIAFLQEDFAYHPALAASCALPYLTAHWAGGIFGLGDGLAIASLFPILRYTRIAWGSSNGIFDSGSDALTPKGFCAAFIDIGDGMRLLAVNLHMDAGGSSLDVSARVSQAEQLAAWISGQNRNPSIIAGDFNLSPSRPEDVEILSRFLAATGFRDSMPSGDDAGPIDKILYRSGGGITLTPSGWALDSSGFVDEQGEQLSDHLPVRVRFALTKE